MGAYIADSDSEKFCEKTQTTTAPKQSYCPFVLFRQYRENRREKRDQECRLKIEKIREQVNKSRKKLENIQKSPWQSATSTEQRRKVFDHGMDGDSFHYYGRKYEKGRKYRLTWTGSRWGHYSMIHDLRTTKGCDEAFKWWEKHHALQGEATTYYMSKCDSWETRYLEYIEKYDSNLRDSLLKGDPTRWAHLKVELLMD